MQQTIDLLDAITFNRRVRIIEKVRLFIVEELDHVGWSLPTRFLLNDYDILVGTMGVFAKLVPRLHVQRE
jgi:hypothetical protein